MLSMTYRSMLVLGMGGCMGMVRKGLRQVMLQDGTFLKFTLCLPLIDWYQACYTLCEGLESTLLVSHALT